jgi:hypothetical protein
MGYNNVRMSPLRSLYVIASASLLATACSGSNLVDIDTSQLPGASSGSSGSGSTSTSSSGNPGGSSGNPAGSSGNPGGSSGNPGGSGSSSSSGGTSPPPGDDGSAGDDTGTSSGGMDATVDAGPPGDGASQDATAPDTGSTPPLDAGSDAGGTFACGPTLRCDPSSEYCYVAPVAVGPIGPVEDIVVPLDASSRYSCVALPACDASDVCICIQGGSSILEGSNIVPTMQCSCNDSGGDITRTCTNSGITPLN